MLVASLGVASVSYVACGSTDISSTTDAGANADGSGDAVDEHVVGNLAGPVDGNVLDRNPPPEDAPVDQLVANLVPPPIDSGKD